MAALDYAQLTKVQRIAVFLITIGPTAAAEVMRGFDNTQLEAICREIAELTLVEREVQEAVMEEFAGIVSQGLGSAMGGVRFAQTALEQAKGDYMANAILNKCSPSSRSGAGDEIRQMEGRQLLNLLKTEQPQTIAFIISCLDTPKAAELLAMLPPDIREEVVERLGSMEATPRESIEKVAKNLGRHFGRTTASQGLHQAGGVQACADILNAMDKEARKTLLVRLEERNPTLGSSIRKKTFSFDELVRLSASDMARVLRDVDSADLPLSLKTAKPALTSAVLASMSKRAAEGFKEELDMMSQPRAKDVEAAQDRIIQVVRRLEEAEEITLDDAAAA